MPSADLGTRSLKALNATPSMEGIEHRPMLQQTCYAKWQMAAAGNAEYFLLSLNSGESQ